MACQYEGITVEFEFSLETINYVFTSFFAIEAILKLLAFGFSYFKNNWNRFDFFVVCASFVDINLSNLNASSIKIIRVGPQLARVLRVLRVSR
jgi:hypothetical protein